MRKVVINSQVTIYKNGYKPTQQKILKSIGSDDNRKSGLREPSLPETKERVFSEGIVYHEFVTNKCTFFT